MMSIFGNYLVTKFVRLGIMVLLTAAMMGCGGGGGSPGITSTGNTGNGKIAIAITDANGVEKSTVTSVNPLTVTVKVTDDFGGPLKGQVVTFTVSASLATIDPPSGTALTDANGLVQVKLVSAGLGSGASSITASVKTGTAAVSATANFSVGPGPVQVPGLGAIRLVLTNTSGVASNEVSAANPLLATATVTDDNGVPLKNQLVTFGFAGGASIATISPATTALTNANGVAQVSLVASGTAGAAVVSAQFQIGSAPRTATANFSAPQPVTTSPVNGAIRIALTDPSGVTSNNIPVGGSLIATATVTDDFGAPVKNQVVTFAITSALALISPGDGTALTDTNGVAKVSIVSAGVNGGATTVEASVKLGSQNLKAVAAFSVGAPPISGNPSISVKLTDSSGNPAYLVTSGSPLLAKATVTDSLGGPIAFQLVTFTVSSSIVTISPVAGTALTDSNGVAQVSIQSAGLGGAGELTATVVVGKLTATGKAAFQVGASPTAKPVAINFVTAIPADKSIVIKGSGGNGRTEVAILTFKVVDNSNSGVANQTVNFKTVTNPPSAGAIPITLAATSGVTDQGGLVTVTLNSGSEPTTVRVNATVITGPNTSISALSDQVTVTTGQPVQVAFSLSLKQFYVEGLNYDNTQNSVNVLLADVFGGAVADGTQIVFTTDTGAIVGNGGARCLTVQGACSVIWRSQNPRPQGTPPNPTGLGTIFASATNAGAPITSSIQFYDSGSFGTVYPVGLSDVAGSTNKSSAPIVTQSFSSNCGKGASQTFKIEVVDVNGNPMPEGTTLSVVNAVNAGAVFTPATVGNTGLHLGGSGTLDAVPFTTRGTLHTMTVTPACVSPASVPAVAPVQGSFLIAVTTPLGGVTYTRVSIPGIQQ